MPLFHHSNSPTTHRFASIQQLIIHHLHCCATLTMLLDQLLKSHSRAKFDIFPWILTGCSKCSGRKHRTLHVDAFSTVKMRCAVQPLLWSLGLCYELFSLSEAAETDECNSSPQTQTHHMAVTAWGKTTQTSSNWSKSTQSNAESSCGACDDSSSTLQKWYQVKQRGKLCQEWEEAVFDNQRTHIHIKKMHTLTRLHSQT